MLFRSSSAPRPVARSNNGRIDGRCQLGGELFPTHELKDKKRDETIRSDFGKAIEKWNKHEYPEAIQMFKSHVKQFPESPWAAEATLHIGCDATYNGRYTEAESIFTQLVSSN